MLRLTRHGWREILVGSLLLGAAAAGLGRIRWPLSFLVLPVWVWLLAFFRDPERALPPGASMVSPADGRVSDITALDHEELSGEACVRVGIFLSVFNVHMNRSPCDGRVALVRYKKGKFINAMNHGQASELNESNAILLVDPRDQRPVAVVKQIVGLIARRIVCTTGPGQGLSRGERIGMIKFGSRTELYIPQRLRPTVTVRVGDKVRGAADVIATLGTGVVPAAADSAGGLATAGGRA